MIEFFWFFLGALVYKILSSLILFGQKGRFINDIKITALVLIGKAYEQLVFAAAIKYKALLKANPNDQQIKTLQNQDEIFLNNWKKETVEIINSSVHPLYKGYLQIDEWDSLIGLLDNYYRKELKGYTKQSEREDKQDFI